MSEASPAVSKVYLLLGEASPVLGVAFPVVAEASPQGDLLSWPRCPPSLRPRQRGALVVATAALCLEAAPVADAVKVPPIHAVGASCRSRAADSQRQPRSLQQRPSCSPRSAPRDCRQSGGESRGAGPSSVLLLGPTSCSPKGRWSTGQLMPPTERTATVNETKYPRRRSGRQPERRPAAPRRRRDRRPWISAGLWLPPRGAR